MTNQEQLHQIYKIKCETPSDINELLPIIREVASKCEICVEFGVRNPTSTYALLDGCPNVISYDIEYHEGIETVKSLAPGFKFIQGSSLEVDIEECDFLFIDTIHTQTQLERELSKHANKAKKYIGFHDTTSFEFRGETKLPDYPSLPNDLFCGRGIWPAIQNFLSLNTEWSLDYRTTKNNGLTILRKN